MTPWSVVKDRPQDSARRIRPFRLAAGGLAALVVLSLGFALIPAQEPAPPEPPLSERARAAAFTEALNLRAVGMRLAAAGAADSGVLDGVVTLLTIQARALQAPTPATAAPSPAPSAAATSDPPDIAVLVRGLAASGAARVKDAEGADGGMARLLAGTGTAQLLAAGRLAAAAGVPAPQGTPAEPGGDASGAGSSASPCVAAPSAASAGGATDGGASATIQQALAAVVAVEEQAIYGYEAALPRLAPTDAGPASEMLGRHEELAAEAVERLRLACGAAPPQQPGYVLDGGFLAAPAAGLARLEAATVASYGDAVAVSQGHDREWALSGLQAAAGRAVRWGADPGPVPGLALDIDQLPVLADSAGPGPSPGS